LTEVSSVTSSFSFSVPQATSDFVVVIVFQVTNHPFDIENDAFTLRGIMEAPLLQFKEDIEDICIAAVKEKEIEAKLKQACGIVLGSDS